MACGGLMWIKVRSTSRAEDGARNGPRAGDAPGWGPEAIMRFKDILVHLDCALESR
jgi:hypothetical protein